MYEKRVKTSQVNIYKWSASSKPLFFFTRGDTSSMHRGRRHFCCVYIALGKSGTMLHRQVLFAEFPSRSAGAKRNTSLEHLQPAVPSSGT